MLKKLLALSLVLAACSGAADSDPTLVDASSPSTSAGEASTSSRVVDDSSATTEPEVPTPGAEVDLFVENAAVFVASLEEAFIGTIFEGAVLESPEVFLAAGEVICVRLDSGDEVDRILGDYIDGLLSNADSGADTVSENEAVVVAGGVLGASLELFCPQHRGLIED